MAYNLKIQFDPQPGGGEQAEPLFFSDWSFGTGVTTQFCGDNGKWPSVFNPGTNLMEVVANPGNLGFPASMENLLKIFADDPAPGVRIGETGSGADAGWGVPAVGEHRYFRFYWYNHVRTEDTLGDGDIDPSHHWFLPSPNTGIWATQSLIGATYFFKYAVDFPPQHQFGASPDLARDVVYRMEMHFHRVANNQFDFEGRFYNSDGSLYNGTDDLVCTLNGHSETGTAGLMPITLADPTDFNGLRGVRIAWEGGGGGFSEGSPPDDYVYIGGWGVRADDWCGPYGTLVGEAQ